MSDAAAAPLLRTPLAPFHAAHRAHLVPFAGWEMPLYYTGILAEHAAVRSAVGMFDVSHMGILPVSGGTAAKLLSRRTTANVERIAPGQCRYSFLLDATGAIFDDLLISRLDAGTETDRTFLVVPNAAHAPAVFDLLREHRRPDTEVLHLNGAAAILAVQGPRSRSALESELGISLAGLGFYHARVFPKRPGSGGADGRLGIEFPGGLDTSIVVSRTGYTGELGYEVFVAGADAVGLAERLAEHGVVPCGLGARDTLRLEKGYLLSGQDFHLDRTPLEAGQDRFVEFDHPFVGRDALEAQRAKGLPGHLVGLEVSTPGAIPRHGTPVRDGDAVVGVVTSGGISPTLGKGIALAYLPPPLAEVGTALTLDLRGQAVAARVTALPFLAASPRR
ncbi:MAG: glycine cleavage system aminomethyltransferase GcvT [Thermoplasmata archaeon]